MRRRIASKVCIIFDKKYQFELSFPPTHHPGIHSESLYSVRQRLLHRMEAENAFDNDDLQGLPDLGQLALACFWNFSAIFPRTVFADQMLAKCEDDPEQQARLIEERMRELHSIYHETKAKLSELERQHRRSVAVRRSGWI
jgi:hypothetical protein